jgi:hypothetical protein
MTWNYRVHRKYDKESDTSTYQVHEVYYSDGRIEGWTESAVLPMGETLPELREDIRFFTKAFQKPVLEERTENGKEILVAEDSQPIINDGHYFELLDRTTVAVDHIYQFLGSHPLMKREEKLFQIYERAEMALSELYHEFGQLDFLLEND